MKKTLIVFAVMALFVMTAASAFAIDAVGNANSSTRNTPDLTNYETPVYATPVVDPTTGDTILTVTNTHYPELVEVSVSKIWDDDDNRDNYRPTAICITLTADANNSSISEEVWNYTLTAADVNTNDDNRWDYTFENLVKFYDGYQILYTAAEEEGQCAAQVAKTQANCEISGGRWENNACTPFSLFAPAQSGGGGGSTPAVDYSTLTTQAACEAASPAGVWTPDSCSNSEYTEESDCTSNGGTWTPGSCAAS
ncbi:MAG: Cna B-type domain-containing protein [Anaerolineaceae bacterium]|nr:Cna B-type domain-containing protein [Anaerolineaceae bacterium]